MDLPLQYIVDKFYQYGGGPKYKRFSNTYEASCPICREGNSWLKKKRLYFVVDENRLFCQNEQRSWSPIEWIKQVSGLTFYEILSEAGEFNESLDSIISRRKTEEKKKVNVNSLPFDSINLFDPLQVKYHKDSQVVIDCLKYIQKRRMDKAINRPRTFYTSLTDQVHKNRLCIPFINKDGKIVFYQTRAIYKADESPAKYLSKINADKSIFGINNIDVNIDYLFIFEGPIDAMFVKNGIAIGGIEMTDKQEEELQPFSLQKKIWVMDNPYQDEAGKKKICKLIERGESVFIPPDDFKQFKDLNELCVSYGTDFIGMGYLVKNSFKGMEALYKLKLS
jgi:hypothetical protein